MKKSLLIFILLFSAIAAYAQQTISGVVTDKQSKESLPFANIFISASKGTITDAEGKFVLDLKKGTTSIRVSYIGYKTITVPIKNTTSYLKIALEPSQESLDAVVLYNKENPALQIIRDAIKLKKENDPERKLNTFKLNSYNKLLVTANPDSINGQIDSIYTKKDGELVFKEVDSSNYSFKKDMVRSHIYLTEKVSEVSFSATKGKREKILATRMAGFKEPIYEVLGIKIQSFSFYKNEYELFGTSYAGPLANNALSKYNYKILDTVTNNNRDAYMIYYSPRKKGKTSGLEGILYVDKESYALQKGIAEIKAVIDIKAVQNFEYNQTFEVWFPTDKEINIKKGKTDDSVSLFGSTVNVQRGSAPIDSTKTVNTNKQDASDFIYLSSKTKNFDLTINKEVSIRGRGLAIEIDELAHDRSEEFWNQYRTDSITKRGKETYVVLDSVIAEDGVEKDIYLARKLLKGYYPTKYVDLDLRYLLKYNNYEAFRLGLGGVTNANFSTKYRVNGYGVYGTRDKDFKFGVGAAARLDKRTQTWFGMSYTDDLVETGSSRFITDRRAFSLFEPRLFNIDLFYEVKRVTANIEHQITAKTQANFMVSRSNVESTYDYGFVNNGEIFNAYDITEATLSIQWNPFSEYMQTRHGRNEIKKGFPQFAFQATKSFDGFGGDFDYTKLDARIVHEIRPIDKGITSFLIKGGLGIGDIPISHLYHTSPNNPNKDVLLQRFSIAGRNSFETMYFNEFFSDKYAMFQAKHQFKPFKITRGFRPELTLITRYAIGDAENIERHLGQQFNSLKHGYAESGFEINKLFAGFGLSFMYRYGAYHLPELQDNISFKFTYYFSLGF